MTTSPIIGRPYIYLHKMFAIGERTGVSLDIVIHQVIQALPSFLFSIITSKKDLSPAQLTKENWTQ